MLRVHLFKLESQSLEEPDMPSKAKGIVKTLQKPCEPGHVVRVMTAAERVADIKAFGEDIRRTKQSAVEFLQRAGIVDETGSLAKPYRTI